MIKRYYDKKIKYVLSEEIFKNGKLLESKEYLLEDYKKEERELLKKIRIEKQKV